MAAGLAILEKMDTDELSEAAYSGILLEAESLTHDLTLLYGLLSYDCKNETEYIEKAEKLTRRLMESAGDELDERYWSIPPDREELADTLSKIAHNIENLKQIPLEKRHYD